MATAKTRTFELTARISADTSADNQELDLTDYVDVADGECFLIEEWHIMLDPNETYPAAATLATFQIADTNITGFVSNNERTSLGVSLIGYSTDFQISTTNSMSADASYGENLVVSRSLWVRNEISTGTALDHTLVIRGKVVKPSAKDYMALVLSQTGQIAA